MFRKLYRCALALLVIGSTLAACEKNEVSGSSETELLSFGPTGAQHGDTLRFIGNNLGGVTAIAFTGATVDKADFKIHTDEEIHVVVPRAAEMGYVTLKTAKGDIVSKTRLNLEVATTVSSMTAAARPGASITLRGEYLNWVERITFANNKVVTSFVSKSMNELVVTVPIDAQTGPLTLFYSGTDSMEVQTADTLEVMLPRATGAAPAPVLHAADLTLTGTDLDLVTALRFNGVSAPVTHFVSQTATSLVVKVPAAARTGKVTLVAPSGVTTQTASDVAVLLPAITGITPNPANAGGDITLNGTNLDLVTAVSFTGVLSPVTSFKSQSATSIVVAVPSGTLKGKVSLSVKNATVKVESSQVLELNGGLPPLADFPFAIYTDGLQNSFQNWSWAGNDFASEANVRQGSKSIKATYAEAYQGITFNLNTAISPSSYSKLEFSVFGEAGTGGKTLNVVINEQWGQAVTVTLVAGEWTTFSLDLSSIAALGSPAMLKQIVLQSTFTGVIHIDHVGLR